MISVKTSKPVTFFFVLFIAMALQACSTTQTYKKRLHIATPDVNKRISNHAPMTLQVDTPVITSSLLQSTIQGRKMGLIRINAPELARAFQEALVKTMTQSNLYRTTTTTPEFKQKHVLKTTVHPGPLNASSPRVYGSYSTKLTVDFSLETGLGKVIKNGTVTATGNFNQGKWTLNFQEKLRYFIEPIQMALREAAKALPEYLVSDKAFVSQLHHQVAMDLFGDKPFSGKHTQPPPTVSADAKREVHSRPSSYSGNHWAVVIGIAEYSYADNNGLKNLAFADDDARAFARKLSELGWSQSHIRLLVNREATQRNIMIALESWLTKAGPDDVIVLFWAGHGFPDPEDPEKVYFACYDTNIAIPATGYRMDKVRVALRERNTRNVLVFADTCHAGKLITRGSRGLSILPTLHSMQRNKQIPKGWVFMVGADTDRQAIEHSSWSNGAFTHSLLKGLSGEADGFQSAGLKDGHITLGELKAFMNTFMPDETLNVLGVAKHPVITTSSGDPDIWDISLAP